MDRHNNRRAIRGARWWALACSLGWQSACLAQGDDDYLRSIEAEAASMAAPPSPGAAPSEPSPPPTPPQPSPPTPAQPAVSSPAPLVADSAIRLRRDDARVRDFELDLLESSPYTYALYVQLGTDAKLGIANGYLSTGGSPEERLREAAERIQALSR